MHSKTCWFVSSRSRGHRIFSIATTMSNKFSMIKYSLPFLSFVVLGSFLLREFTSIRYEVYNYKRRYVGTKRRDTDGDVDNNSNVLEEETKQNIEEQNQKEVEKLIEAGRSNEWRNIRGPRPWEDNREYQELVVEKVAAGKNKK